MTGNADIRGFIKRDQSILSELDDLKETRRDLYAEAKAAGINTKAMRETVKRLAQDPAERAAFEAVVDDYTSQLDMFKDRAA